MVPLVPLKEAFQPLLYAAPEGKVTPTRHPLIEELPAVTSMLATNPPCHWSTRPTVAVQPPPPPVVLVAVLVVLDDDEVVLDDDVVVVDDDVVVVVVDREVVVVVVGGVPLENWLKNFQISGFTQLRAPLSQPPQPSTGPCW